MKKAILCMASNVVYAITENNDNYINILDIKSEPIDYLDNEYEFFKNNEKTIFKILKDAEFKQDLSCWFYKDGGPYTRLMESLENFNLDSNNMNLDDMLNYWGACLYTGMGTNAVGLRVQYINIKKPVIKRTLKVFDSEEDWTFTFSTYKDDLNSLAYEKALNNLNERYKSCELKTEYSIEDLTQMTDFYLKENPQLISAKNKIERNMCDYKNNNSVYVRLDKDIITEEDINHIIEKFKIKNYMIFK